MATIFISYRRTDSKHATSRIHDRLRLEFGKEHVFKDVDSIPIGTDFRGVLKNALGQCKVTLVMIGPAWVNCADTDGTRRLLNPADYVRLELEAVLGRDIPVVPVLLDDASPPRPNDLPESLQSISYRHAITINDDPHFDDDIARLIRGIRRLLEPAPVAPPVAVAPPPPGEPKLTNEERLQQAEADHRRGDDFYFGRGVPQDYAKAREWYERAAALGSANAQCNLGILYDNGFGVTKDYAKAREWYERAASQGYASAQCNLGILYDNGFGVTKDYAEAREWYERAAAQGNAIAQCGLGVLYDNGEGMPQDHAKAREWYERAAAQGNAIAQYNLAFMYEHGRGVAKNETRALEWYRKAAANGDDDAKKAVERLTKPN